MNSEDKPRPIEELLMDEEAVAAIRLLQAKGYSPDKVAATLDHMNYTEPWHDVAAEKGRGDC